MPEQDLMRHLRINSTTTKKYLQVTALTFQPPVGMKKGRHSND
jgi:hypothetical protein